MNSNETIPVITRVGTPDDLPLVLASWKQSFESSPLARSLRKSIYYARWNAIIERLLTRSQVLIAVSPEEPSVILGWLAFELHPTAGPVLHYLYTKGSFRQAGIARALLQAAGLSHGVYTYTHRTIDSQRICGAWDKDGKASPTYDFTLIWE